MREVHRLQGALVISPRPPALPSPPLPSFYDWCQDAAKASGTCETWDSSVFFFGRGPLSCSGQVVHGLYSKVRKGGSNLGGAIKLRIRMGDQLGE